MLVGAPASRSEFQCASILAAQKPVDSEIGLATESELSISNEAFVVFAYVLAAQGLGESEMCISMMYAL